ncbi:Bifunctional folate synthesis protein [Dyadobacter sp. CECT 9275]|uniref:2-amino-4-hydroxy-6-hydroxymethyldihydropteridine pyrophosphokinase n=1 Tax=Dyadobacter helix TaxID=2822344 RepID=A0A916JGI6_9BACT|nr:2-amino-4-hydroxy-6-hydroxymethyldihydropteridine diphosphokinase [Dyadobacter sp. CECT 9275]CAG5009187.1 Bifunctional folate synthesis protein [Dyadobacter sp. CECT 9275]
MARSNSVYLLLGSNLGERSQVLQAARLLIGKRVGEIVRASSVYETSPWGVTDQPAFMNQVLEVNTALQPEEVLRIVLEAEHELGRIRYEKWGARVIDIDILYYNDFVLAGARLTVPHPRLHERRFTLVPLSEIASDFLHPLFKKTSAELLSTCTDDGEVMKLS